MLNRRAFLASVIGVSLLQRSRTDNCRSLGLSNGPTLPFVEDPVTGLRMRPLLAFHKDAFNLLMEPLNRAERE